MSGDLEREQAKAIQATAKVGEKVVDALMRTGGYVGEVLGKVPHDAVGLLGGDYLHEARIRNAASLREKTREKLRQRGITDTRPLSPLLTIPLIDAAVDESRDELQELWARLLANAMDPSRPQIRQSFIEALKKFDPVDALVLSRLHDRGALTLMPSLVTNFGEPIGAGEDEILVSVDHLRALGCVDVRRYGNNADKADVTPFGRLLMIACAP